MEREMKKIMLMLFLVSITANLYASNFERYKHPTQSIVFLKTNIDGFRLSLQNNINHQIISIRSLGTEKQALISVPLGFEINDLINEIRVNQHVEMIVPNYVYLGHYPEMIPNDPLFQKQNHHMVMKNNEAWNISTGKEEIVVAVTDDGFKLDHEDLLNSWFHNSNEIPNNNIDDDQNGYIDDVIGYDFNEMDNDPMSDSRNGSHGTHVAGIVAAGFNNGIGVVGHGPKIKVMPIKFYGKNSWTSAIVLESYTYAANNGAKIITTSYMIDNFVGDVAYERALTYAYGKGLILFNSGGNGRTRQSKRTAFTKLLLVASTRSTAGWRSAEIDTKSSFSNYGRGIDISAPGEPIHSTGRSLSYVDMSGTSMAAPNAAGTAALIWSAHPEYSRAQVVAKLMMGSDNIDALNKKYINLLGAGRVNAKNSLSEIYKAPHVINARYLKKEKELRIHLWGVLAPKSFSRAGGIILRKKTTSGMSDQAVSLKHEYFLGTNELVLPIIEKGQYELLLLSRKIVDPFGQELDGDHNGQAGGDFVFNFSVK
jgi:subtilisin family serine protease